jgi:Sec-independent protein translocase protein TatA
MNIFGIGGTELALILIIMLVVAGPKRMIYWAYIIGQYTAKLRRFWEETVDYVQHEFDEAGVDIQIPKEPPTRASLNKAIVSAMKPVTQPVEEALKEVNTVKTMATTSSNGNGRPAEPPPAQPGDTASGPSLGTWSGAQDDDETKTP